LAEVLDQLARAAADEAADVTGLFAALGRSPSPAIPRNPGADVICTGVEVGDRHADGIAYLAFQFNAAGDLLEHGLSVVYHPTRGSFWSDAEGLNQIADE
jgi:hypothetical protein